MNMRKFVAGGIVGGVVYFFLGYVIYGMLLRDFFKPYVAGVDRGDELIFWSIILANLFMGFLLSYVLNRSNVGSISDGVVTGAVLGLLFSGSFDLIMYGTTHLSSLRQVATDMVISTALSAIAGAVIAAVARPVTRIATA
jgi:uncharacterized membrane protein